MPTSCGVRGSDVPIGHAVHATVHTKTDVVVDHYVRWTCYEDRLAPPFE